jgi:RAQPRD family integrative conjugative element protein
LRPKNRSTGIAVFLWLRDGIRRSIASPHSRFLENAMLSRSLALACAVPLLAVAGLSPAFADEAPERERLAALLRQLDLIDRLAEGAAEAASQGESRYRFDYLRLKDDIERVRAGVKDYLAPPRAQPRDLAPLSGEYRVTSAPPEDAP